MQKILVLILSAYRYAISPLFGYRCRFYPSCSEYAQQCIHLHGSLCGSWLTLKRLSRCHPWHPGGFDPAPEKTQHI